jgi:hypothetical protein
MLMTRSHAWTCQEVVQLHLQHQHYWANYQNVEHQSIPRYYVSHVYKHCKTESYAVLAKESRSLFCSGIWVTFNGQEHGQDGMVVHEIQQKVILQRKCVDSMYVRK